MNVTDQPASDIGQQFASLLAQMSEPGAIAYWIGILGPTAPPLVDGDALGMCSTMSYLHAVDVRDDATELAGNPRGCRQITLVDVPVDARAAAILRDHRSPQRATRAAGTDNHRVQPP